jgi:hypothetical protein
LELGFSQNLQKVDFCIIPAWNISKIGTGSFTKSPKLPSGYSKIQITAQRIGIGIEKKKKEKRSDLLFLETLPE